jgi:hypothetical protein
MCEEKLVSIKHTACGGEAFKYVGPVAPGEAVYAGRVREHHAEMKPEPNGLILCKCCGDQVRMMDLTIQE